MAVNKFYEISGNKAKKIKPSCPRCGPGVFLGEHKNRNSCGKCGYTEFKK
jgi:small subunit ribosomal protein S27Ae